MYPCRKEEDHEWLALGSECGRWKKKFKTNTQKTSTQNVVINSSPTSYAVQELTELYHLTKLAYSYHTQPPTLRKKKKKEAQPRNELHENGERCNPEFILNNMLKENVTQSMPYCSSYNMRFSSLSQHTSAVNVTIFVVKEV